MMFQLRIAALFKSWHCLTNDRTSVEALRTQKLTLPEAIFMDTRELSLRVPPTLIFFRVMNIFGSVMVQNGHQQNLRVIT